MSLSVLTLNIWGLWLVSKKREERVKHICNYLQSCEEVRKQLAQIHINATQQSSRVAKDPQLLYHLNITGTYSQDVVLLQEVWVDSDAQQLIQAGRASGLAHSTHFRSGIFGAGLVTLSRHPIIRHGFWRYAAAGFATSISCGDYYAGKGVGWVRVLTPVGEVDVFNTHLHANYCHEYRQPEPHLAKAAAAAVAAVTSADLAAATGSTAKGRTVPQWAGSRIPDDDDAGIRISQLLELSEIIRLVSGSGSSSGTDSSSSSLLRHVVLGGDLNCKPDTLEVDLLRLRLPELQDAWPAAARRGSSDGGSGSSNPEGYTCHAPGNTFQPRRQVPERIDYVWTNLACRKAELALQMSPGGTSYSDHFAVRATLDKVDGSNDSSGTAGSGPMKLGSSTKQHATMQQQGGQDRVTGISGEGSKLDMPKRIATVMGSQMLLEEGMRCFNASRSVMSLLGAFCLASVVYVAVALPLLLPDVVFRGWLITLGFITVGFVTAVGVAALLMGQVADKSQKRALQNSYRLLRVWMPEAGIDVPYTTTMQF